MDSFYKPSQEVEALDTSSGVWRSAVVRIITALTITIRFPGWSSHLSTVQEHISEEMAHHPSRWPIRNATAPLKVANSESAENCLRGKRNALTEQYV